MKLFRTLFLPAIALSSASAFASVVPSGIAIASPRTMFFGTSAEISASRDAAPMADSMRASSDESGPMWRAMNSAAFSSSASGVGAVSDMTGFQAVGQQEGARRASDGRGRMSAGGAPRWRRARVRKKGSERLQKSVVAGAVHQLVELGHVGDLHLEEP